MGTRQLSRGGRIGGGAWAKVAGARCPREGPPAQRVWGFSPVRTVAVRHLTLRPVLLSEAFGAALPAVGPTCWLFHGGHVAEEGSWTEGDDGLWGSGVEAGSRRTREAGLRLLVAGLQ